MSYSSTLALVLEQHSGPFTYPSRQAVNELVDAVAQFQGGIDLLRESIHLVGKAGEDRTACGKDLTTVRMSWNAQRVNCPGCLAVELKRVHTELREPKSVQGPLVALDVRACVGLVDALGIVLLVLKSCQEPEAGLPKGFLPKAIDHTEAILAIIEKAVRSRHVLEQLEALS